MRRRIGRCICAGKSSIQQYLIEQHSFQPLKIARTVSTPSVEKSASEAHVPSPPDETTSTLKPQPQTFATVEELLDFATQHWQENYVTTSIDNEHTVDVLARRPLFVLIHVDSPISQRWQRFRTRCELASLAPPTLEEFVLRNDDHHYSPTSGLASLASRAQIKILNKAPDLTALRSSLDALALTDQTRIRPTWDHYFMTLSNLAARRSNCMRRQVGCVLVRAHRVISTGYNGTPRNLTNCTSGGCPRCNDAAGTSGGQSLATCLCIHAEENALLEAGRDRVGGGAVLYCNTCPCLTCSIKIVQVGIAEVVFSQSYYMDEEAARIFREAGVKLRQFSPPREGLVVLGDEAGV